MQILLTKKEYDALIESKQLTDIVNAGKLQELCSAAANNIPVPKPWSHDKSLDPSPWGCILDQETNPGYCDDCPSSEVCPYDRKRWSK